VARRHHNQPFVTAVPVIGPLIRGTALTVALILVSACTPDVVPSPSPSPSAVATPPSPTSEPVATRLDHPFASGCVPTPEGLDEGVIPEIGVLRCRTKFVVTSITLS
jgi:hypothetical protein